MVSLVSRTLLLLLLGTATLYASSVAGVEAATVVSRYDLDYTITAVPSENAVDVRLKLGQDRHLLREMRFAADNLSNIAGDGELSTDDSEVIWQPPVNGGELRWRASVNHKRGSSYDAWLDAKWGLFRAEDVIPRAATRTLKGARSNTSLRFKLPARWSVTTEYKAEKRVAHIVNPARRFTQPSGWIVMGKLGVRRERIAGTQVAVAAPIGEDVRRMDMLALLNWTLPELARILPSPPPRVTIVSAGRPMWRGGLSAPQSLYIHADRPLISENGTSTLLHEIMHIAMGASAERGYDWIVEGMAEYYSLQLLARSGTITQPRLKEALKSLADWAKSADELCGASSTGPRTALAVGVMHALDKEIDHATRGKKNLDDVLAELLKHDARFNLRRLQAAANKILGENPDALHSDRLPGCSKLTNSD